MDLEPLSSTSDPTATGHGEWSTLAQLFRTGCAAYCAVHWGWTGRGWAI